jgi:hypothetical protein
MSRRKLFEISRGILPASALDEFLGEEGLVGITDRDFEGILSTVVSEGVLNIDVAHRLLNYRHIQKKTLSKILPNVIYTQSLNEGLHGLNNITYPERTVLIDRLPEELKTLAIRLIRDPEIDVNVIGSNYGDDRPIFMSIKNHRNDILSELLKRPIYDRVAAPKGINLNVHQKDGDMLSVIEYAPSISAPVEIIKTLLSDPRIKLTKRALEISAERYPFNPDASLESFKEMLKHFKDRVNEANEDDSYYAGNTLLHNKSIVCREAFLRLLLQTPGIDVLVKNKKGKIPLDVMEDYLRWNYMNNETRSRCTGISILRKYTKMAMQWRDKASLAIAVAGNRGKTSNLGGLPTNILNSIGRFLNNEHAPLSTVVHRMQHSTAAMNPVEAAPVGGAGAACGGAGAACGGNKGGAYTRRRQPQRKVKKSRGKTRQRFNK